MTRCALVTGATGMLGSYIVGQLVAGGWSVRALVRYPGGATWLEEMGAELVPGSLEDRDSLVAAARRCDAVFHTAAEIGAGAGEKFRRGNVLGTANVVEAAAEGARLIHVSTTAVFGRARYHDKPTDESYPLPALPEYDAYGRSKQQAETVVLEAHAAGRIWGAVVRPPVMYGLRDRQFVPRLGPLFERRIFPLIDGGRAILTLVHAGSVAEGAILASSTKVAGGRVFHLTNDHPVDVSLLAHAAGEGLGRRIVTPTLPLAVGAAAFAALRIALRVAGRGDLARHAHGTLEMLTRDNPFTSERARSELGWQPSGDPAAKLAEAFRWWKNNVRTPTHGA